jgi:Berberine and berberine like
MLSDEGAEGLRRAYPADKLAQLAAVKNAYDPDNAFHLNQNIPPRRPEHVQAQQTAAPDRPSGNMARKRQTT